MMSTEIVSAQITPVKVVVKENGAKGDTGAAGANGIGFNSVRQEVVNNPLLWIFKKNKLVETIAPNNEDADLSTLRATTKTYIDRYGVLKVAAINELPSSINGYEIEKASTNLVLYSEEIQNAAWTKGTDYTFTGNTLDITDPYGTNLATKVEGGSTPSQYFITQPITSSAGLHTVSIWVYVPTQVGFPDYNVDMYLGSDFVASLPITEFDKWVRLDETINATSPSDVKFEMQADGGQKPGDFDFYVFGAQVEVGSVVSSYMPSGATNGSRGGDDVTCDAYNNMPRLNSPFTFALDIYADSGVTDQVYYVLCFDETGSTVASSCLVKETAGTFLFRYADPLVSNDLRFTVVNDKIQTIAIVFDGTNLRAYADGQEVGQFLGVTANPISDTSSKVFIGRAISAAVVQYSSPYSNLRIWDTALVQQEVEYIS